MRALDKDHEPRFLIQSLRRDHERKAFCCGQPELDRYLKEQAGQDAKRNLAAPFVALVEGSRAIAGFYTLSMTGIDIGSIPENIARKLPKYPKIPAVLLGRLAVDQQFQGKGLGQTLLIDALRNVVKNDVAWLFFIVDAKDESAATFYKRFGFTHLPDRPNALFMHRAKIEDLLKSSDLI